MRKLKSRGGDDTTGTAEGSATVGKRTRTGGLVSRKARTSEPSSDAVRSVEAASSTPGDPIEPSVQGRLETALGTDLSCVRVHTGPESAAAAGDLGAHAFASGQEIHFASGKYDPGTREGDRLLAHEVAHTVQQRGVAAAPQCELEVSSPGDPLEQEADHFAMAFEQGGSAPVSIGAARGEVVHRLSFGDVASVALGPVAGRGLEVMIEQIRDAGGLEAALRTATGSAGAELIDWAAENKVDVLLDFLERNTGHHLLVYSLRRLSLDDVARFLARLSPENVMDVAVSMIINGGLQRLADAMWELSKEQLRIFIRALTPQLAKDLFRLGRHRANQFAKEVLQEIWPVGFGIEVEAGVGAAFGIPLKIDLSGQLIATRRDEDIVEFYRRGEGFVGAYFGLSVGGYAGTGGKSDGVPGGRDSTGLGIGAQAGVEAQAGLTGIITQKFDFPIFQDDGFLTMVVAALGLEGAVAIGSLFSDSLASIDPMRFHRSTKFEAKVGGQVTGGAEAGVRAGQGSTGLQTGTSREGGPDNGSKLQWWNPAKLLRVSAFAGVKAWAGIGMEFENSSMHPDPQTGEMEPEETKVILSAEVGAALNLAVSIPMLTGLLSALPNLNGALGIKFTFRYGRPSGPDDEPPLLGISHSFFAKNGDIDTPVQAATASETELAFAEGDPRHALDLDKQLEKFESWDKFLASVEGMQLQRRVGVRAMGNAIVMTLMKQRDLSSMLKARYRESGLRIEGYLHFILDLNPQQVRQLFEAIRTFLGSAADRSLVRIFSEVVTFFATGTAPDYVKVAFEQLAGTLGDSLENVRAHFQIGANVALGGKVATFRGHLHAGGMLTYDQDVTEEVRDELDDLYRVIATPSTAGEALDVEPEALGLLPGDEDIAP